MKKAWYGGREGNLSCGGGRCAEKALSVLLSALYHAVWGVQVLLLPTKPNYPTRAIIIPCLYVCNYCHKHNPKNSVDVHTTRSPRTHYPTSPGGAIQPCPHSLPLLDRSITQESTTITYSNDIILPPFLVTPSLSFHITPPHSHNRPTPCPIIYPTHTNHTI